MFRTNGQKMAQRAYEKVSGQVQSLSFKEFKEYLSFSREFPTLVHTCGLAQAVVFAQAKGHERYLEDLVAVLQASVYPNLQNLLEESRERDVLAYFRLSRDVLLAADWLKRYAEASKERK